MNMNWEKPVVVITGASSGIGKAAAIRFAEEGARLVLAARRKNLLQDLAQHCKELGADAIPVECDVSDQSDVEGLARKAIRHFGRIDVWVNDAGVSTIGRFDEVPMRENEQVIHTNLLGVMYGSHAAIRHFRETSRRGVLINIASVLGKSPAPYQAAYVASKHAIVGLSGAIRQELWANGERDIHVCTIMPPSINTPFFRHAANHSGHRVEPIPPVYAPERVAEAIVQTAWRPRDEVSIGGVGKFLNLQQKFSKKLSEKQLALQTHSTQMKKAAPEGDRSGILFKPSKEGVDVRDEWSESGKYVDAVGTAIGTAIPVAIGFWLWRRFSEPETEREEIMPAA